MSTTENPRKIRSSFYFLCFTKNLFFSIRVFFHRHRRFTEHHRTASEGRVFQSSTSIRSRTFRHLFATLHLRWLSHIFNCTACIYQTATRWDLPPYPITIWLIDWWCRVCLFTWWFDSRFLLKQFNKGSRRIWTCIDYHPCITSKPTNQVCWSPQKTFERLIL